jgi:glutathione S-transferase
MMFYEKDETRKAEMLKTLKEQSLPQYLEKFEKIQAENGGNFMVGKSVTWADVWIANALERFEGSVDAKLLDNYPNLKKMKDAVFAIPKVKAYAETRPAQ